MPTKRDYLAARANRLDRLCQLKAPPIILRGEVALILQALTWIVQEEEGGIEGLTVQTEALRQLLTRDRGTEHAHGS